MEKPFVTPPERLETQFIPILDLSDLEKWLALSKEQEVVIFKHSTTCPISAAAYDEISKLRKKVGIVVVQSSRDISSELAIRTGVEHQSPQAIIIRNGEPVWSASHWNITSDAVAKALAESR